jgi:hypothetical protein
MLFLNQFYCEQQATTLRIAGIGITDHFFPLVPGQFRLSRRLPPVMVQ